MALITSDCVTGVFLVVLFCAVVAGPVLVLLGSAMLVRHAVTDHSPCSKCGLFSNTVALVTSLEGPARRDRPL